jgi:hypothetical protein
MIRVVSTNDSPKHLEHGLDLDGAIHDRVGTLAQGIGQAPGRTTYRGRAGTNHHRGRWSIQATKDLEQPFTTGLVRGTVEGDPEVDDGNVHRTNLQEGGGLFGGAHPKALDSDGFEKSWQLLGEILTLPPPIAQHQRQPIAFGSGSRVG